MQLERIKIGVVGFGKIARDQHLPAIRANPRFELSAIVCPENTKREVPVFRDLESLLRTGPDLDAVVLCTPPAVRAELAQRALSSDLHVLLEKPPAVTPAELKTLKALALRAGKTLMTAWHSRETAAVDRARAWLQGHKIKSVSVKWLEDIRKWHPGQEWLLSDRGFGVFDPAINALSILTCLMPGTLSAKSANLGVPANRAAPMEASIALSCDGGVPVICDFSIMHQGQEQWDIDIETDGGTLSLRGGGHTLLIDGREDRIDPDEEYPRIYRYLALLIDTGGSDVDARPLTLVAESVQIALVHELQAFHF